MSAKNGWFIPEMVSGLKRNGCPDNPGIGGWIAPEYAGQHCELNSQLRPNIVMFGEQVLHLDEARNHIKSADKVIAVGSTLTVRPAALLLKKAPFKAEKILVSLDITGKRPFGYKFIRGKAASIVPTICKNWVITPPSHR